MTVRNSLRSSLQVSWILLVALAAPEPVRADLQSYVKAKDPSFSWYIERRLELPQGGSACIVRLTSQTWHGVAWKHWVTVLRPETVSKQDHALLLIAGGSNRSGPPRGLSGEAQVLARIAEATGSVVTVVSQVPNQPLLGDRYEDDLIAQTFEKYLQTGDETWLCLLPMVKSAVGAMDAVQALAEKEYSQRIRHFVVTGASKRGWTTWLTGAVDSRVVAIAPMVIDVLNIAKQMPHQVLSFGTYSEKIHDYSDRNLPDRLQQPEAKRLLEIVDPYSYREGLTIPKLILLGTNDRYWPVDAVKLYFDDLKGPKFIHYVPNKGHGLGADAAVAVAAFYDRVLEGKPLPRFRWKFDSQGPRASLAIDTDDPPLAAELWRASAPTRDFRDAHWSPTPMEEGTKGRYVGKLQIPETGFAALFGRLTFASRVGQDYTLSTNVEVVEGKGP